MTVGNLTFAQSVKHDYPDFNTDSLGVFIIPLGRQSGLECQSRRADEVHLVRVKAYR